MLILAKIKTVHLLLEVWNCHHFEELAKGMSSNAECPNVWKSSSPIALSFHVHVGIHYWNAQCPNIWIFLFLFLFKKSSVFLFLHSKILRKWQGHELECWKSKFVKIFYSQRISLHIRLGMSWNAQCRSVWTELDKIIETEPCHNRRSETHS